MAIVLSVVLSTCKKDYESGRVQIFVTYQLIYPKGSQATAIDDGAVIKLENNNRNSLHIHQGITSDCRGEIIFDNVVYGTYTLTVAHPCYNTYTNNNFIISNEENNYYVEIYKSTEPNVYVVGRKGGEAFLWNNGELPLDMAIAKSVFVSGKDVYIAGNQYSGGLKSGKLWKNGVKQDLFRTSANAVFVNGNDVYVVGGLGYLWINGSSYALSERSSTDDCEAYSVFVDGNDVYVAGKIYYNPVLWKNGEAQRLGNSNGVPVSVYVQGNDVYAVGDAYEGGILYATLWKNGIEQRLSNKPSVARSVFVFGNDVYVVGSIFDYRTFGNPYTVYHNEYVAVWKNGVEEDQYPHFGRANSVYVSENDVYVVGTIYNTATLLKNGFGHPLNDNSSAYSVFVIK